MIKGDYFMGNKATFVDIQLFDLFESSLGKFIPGFSTDPYPELEAIVKRVKANPEIAAYLAKHLP
ncbi:Glutathione S-transferase [Phytophthora palmivora]|nr:Glutathione S-transferase [Phytophthora palmivora]